MQDTLMSIQIVPKTPNNEDVIPYVDEAIKLLMILVFILEWVLLKRQFKAI